MDYERYSYENSQVISHENPYGSGVDRSYIPREPEKKPKKTGQFWKKMLLAVGLGIFFGISAGVSFYFVNLATGVADLTKNKTVTEDTVPVEREENEMNILLTIYFIMIVTIIK